MSQNILTIQEAGTTWFYKIFKSVTEKPLYHCLENAKKKDHQLILSYQTPNGRRFGSYRNVDEMMTNLFKSEKKIYDCHLYEILPENLPRYLYADLEWIENNQHE